ncbi:hypothetical protein CUB95_06485 [Prevotella intermedia]|nr:hypothetical protein CUB95_06485 [Prevotella intermedia]
MQKTADRSNSHTSENNSVTYFFSIVTNIKKGNTLVTELLPKSACFCPLQTEQHHANLCIPSSLSVSLHQLRHFFIFFD